MAAVTATLNTASVTATPNVAAPNVTATPNVATPNVTATPNVAAVTATPNGGDAAGPTGPPMLTNYNFRNVRKNAQWRRKRATARALATTPNAIPDVAAPNVTATPNVAAVAATTNVAATSVTATPNVAAVAATPNGGDAATPNVTTMLEGRETAGGLKRRESVCKAQECLNRVLRNGLQNWVVIGCEEVLKLAEEELDRYEVAVNLGQFMYLSVS